MNKNFYCVIMAGGIGSRFWPVSRNDKPKQFLDFLNCGRTFLQMTYDRFSRIISPNNIFIVTSDAYAEMVAEQLPALSPKNILTEPCRRNTAPCIAYATYKIKSINPDATVVVAPSDHFISNENLFIQTIATALEYASANDKLITMGIEPTRPETAYGYIQLNMKQSEQINGYEVFDVKTFTEKPEVEMAEVFLKSGEFLWNSGIFVWKISSLIPELERYLPDIAQAYASCTSYNTADEKTDIDRIYENCVPISIDYGIMEQTEKSWVFRTSFGWSDLGTWESLFQYFGAPDKANIVKAKTTIINNTENTAIWSSNDSKLIAVSGLKDFMVVETPDVLMICPRDEQSIKNLITDITVEDLKSFQ